MGRNRCFMTPNQIQALLSCEAPLKRSGSILPVNAPRCLKAVPSAVFDGAPVCLFHPRLEVVPEQHGFVSTTQKAFIYRAQGRCIDLQTKGEANGVQAEC